MINNLNVNILDINVNNNILISEYDIKKDKLNTPIRIFNSYEECKKEISWFEGINNEKEIKDNCEIFLNNIKKNFNYKFQFTQEEINQFEIIFKNPLNYANFIFCNCTLLTKLDLSNFNTNNYKDMCRMFYKCSSLVSIYLSNININNVTNRSHIFYDCCNLKSLNLSKFITNNVKNMREMFYKCSSLISLDLSSFNIPNVTDMSYMFSSCNLLNSLDLSNFKSNNVKDMRSMFCDCFSLTYLNLSNFSSENVTDMSEIFKDINQNCLIISNDILINYLKSKIFD